MKFPFSIFGKKAESSSKASPGLEKEKEREPAAFPVELAVAQVQAETGLRFGSPPAQISELQEAAAVLMAQDVAPAPAPAQAPTATPTPQLIEPSLEPAPAPVSVPKPTLVPKPVPSAATEAADPVDIAAPASVTANAPVPSPTQPGVGHDEVVAAYRMFLRRDPESDAVIEPRLGIARERLLSTFMVSPEFLQRPENVKLLLEVAKSLEQRQTIAEPAPGIPVLTAADVEAAKRIFWPEPHDQAIQPVPGDTADRTLAQLMRSEHFQKNEFNANLVTALAREIVQRLSQKSSPGLPD
jgi:hypothetical protein